jgi:5'-3' exonuclease
MSHYLLIDLGYFYFFRFFAAKSWYKHRDEYTDDEAMSNDPLFQSTLKKRVEQSITKIISKLNIPWNQVIFCRDCPQSLIWRKDDKEDYKGNRTANLNVKTGFALITEQISHLIETHGCYRISQDHLEADDLVYLVRQYILSKNANSLFTIITSDIDYYQICYPNTKILRLDNRDAMKNSLGNPELDLLVKIIQGDKSDNILPIIPRCGAKTALKYANDPLLLKTLLDNNETARDNFKKNQRLIDLSHIPMELQTKVNSKLEKEFPIISLEKTNLNTPVILDCTLDNK